MKKENFKASKTLSMTTFLSNPGGGLTANPTGERVSAIAESEIKVQSCFAGHEEKALRHEGIKAIRNSNSSLVRERLASRGLERSGVLFNASRSRDVRWVPSRKGNLEEQSAPIPTPSLTREGKRAAFTKPSRGTNDSERPTIMPVMNIQANWRRCRLSRGAVSGFTLAEVLITLGIVGIVAAITLPNLMMTLQGNKYRNQFKKTLSTLNQAVRSAQAQYDLDFAALNEGCSFNPASENPDTKHSLCAVFNATLKGARYNSVYELTNNYNPPYTCGLISYQLSDGSIVAFKSRFKDCKLPNNAYAVTEDMLKSGGALENCVGFIDVNGKSGPNEVVQGIPVDTSSFDYHRLLDRVAFEYDTSLINSAFADGSCTQNFYNEYECTTYDGKTIRLFSPQAYDLYMQGYPIATDAFTCGYGLFSINGNYPTDANGNYQVFFNTGSGYGIHSVASLEDAANCYQPGRCIDLNGNGLYYSEATLQQTLGPGKIYYDSDLDKYVYYTNDSTVALMTLCSSGVSSVSRSFAACETLMAGYGGFSGALEKCSGGNTGACNLLAAGYGGNFESVEIYCRNGNTEACEILMAGYGGRNGAYELCRDGNTGACNVLAALGYGAGCGYSCGSYDGPPPGCGYSCGSYSCGGCSSLGACLSACTCGYDFACKKFVDLAGGSSAVQQACYECGTGSIACDVLERYAAAGYLCGYGYGGSSDKCAANVFDPQARCNVPNKRHYINDIFPIVFHDGVVEPASGPARNVLHTAK